MIARLRAWLEETHSDNFELVRHFVLRFFDNEMILPATLRCASRIMSRMFC